MDRTLPRPRPRGRRLLRLPVGQGGLSQAGVATVSVGILMAVWWITEALPLPATALLPIALMGPARYCQSTSADITNLRPGVHNV